MQVILLEDVPALGSIGDEVAVKPGYGRNYLLPRGYAVVASQKKRRELEHHRRVAAHRRAKVRADAEALAEKLQQVTLTMPRKVGEHDKLFGSVTSLDIERSLQEQQIPVDRRKIKLSEPIKSTGEFEVPVRLQSDVDAAVKVVVVPEE